MRPGPIAILSLIFALAGCQSDGHKALGTWNGVLINQGVTVDLGKVHIGSDYIDLSAIDEHYQQLAFVDTSDAVRFGRKDTANFQGKSDSGRFSSRYPEGRVVFDDNGNAQLRINKIQGVIKLTR